MLDTGWNAPRQLIPPSLKVGYGQFPNPVSVTSKQLPEVMPNPVSAHTVSFSAPTICLTGESSIAFHDTLEEISVMARREEPVAELAAGTVESLFGPVLTETDMIANSYLSNFQFLFESSPRLEMPNASESVDMNKAWAFIASLVAALQEAMPSAQRPAG